MNQYTVFWKMLSDLEQEKGQFRRDRHTGLNKGFKPFRENTLIDVSKREKGGKKRLAKQV